MKLYNTLTRDFTDYGQTKKVNIYACGSTVYNYIHIGNARAIISVDLLVSFLQFQGIEVNYVQNYTDIDDKIINKAAAEHKTEQEIAEFYIQAFEEDVTNLNIKMPTKWVRVTDHIHDIVTFIQALIKIGAAYEVKGNVYFNIKKYQEVYGCLANKKLAELEVNARIDHDENKHSQYDFALWKNTSTGLSFPFYDLNGQKYMGRPGWHTECAVLIDKFFNNQTIDIHAGGIDLVFPHHENERIQFFAKNEGKEISKIWMHNGHLNVANEKMSKSLDNSILVRDFIKLYGANTLRYLLYATNYTQPLNVTDTIIGVVQNEIDKILKVLKAINLFLAEYDLSYNLAKHGDHVKKVLVELENNLNSPNVLTIISQMIKMINTQLRNKMLDLQLASDFYNIIFNIMNFNFKLPVISGEIREYLLEWIKSKDSKDFVKADELRKVLLEKDIL
ncbi:cysteine--tRNA ligase [Spiroplasma endosymbiont of Glossina fuscipes fuscipes]|uniref:cysteine--tRNA ligase n=1 Tax=Spiroplasma endosymbiont of Glossina fuscipes fuscipes TaxID=2004463 RepID=UPI003C74E082